jgi:hypothetical protein
MSAALEKPETPADLKKGARSPEMTLQGSATRETRKKVTAPGGRKASKT